MTTNPSVTRKTKITVKQTQFAEHYVANGGNATAAYIAAGYSVHSQGAAGVEGHKLLKNPNIRALVDKLQEDISTETLTEVKEILRENRAIAFSNILDVIEISEKTHEISIKDLSKIPEETAKAIQEITTQTTKTGSLLKVKMHDKMRALEMLAKINGLESDMNIAIATFRRYGYDVRETAEGFVMVDTYKQN